MLAALAGCGKSDEELVRQWEVVHAQTFSESPEKAHAGYQKLADEFHKAGNWAFESCCLYEMANDYFNQRDTLGLKRVMDRLRKLNEDHPDDPGVGYSYHSMMSGWYAALYEEDGLDSTRDGIFREIRAALDRQEKMTQQELDAYKINPIWNFCKLEIIAPSRVFSLNSLRDSRPRNSATTGFLTNSSRSGT